MKTYTDIFHAYDIRGTYPDQLDEAGAYALGKAFGDYLNTITTDGSLLIGSDVRKANADLIYWFIAGLESQGISNVVTAAFAPFHESEHDYPWGVCTTALLYSLVTHTDLGVMFTASHNPPQYVGMKACTREAISVPRGEIQSRLEPEFDRDYTIDQADKQRMIDAYTTQSPLFGIIESEKNNVASYIADKFGSLGQTTKIAIDYSTGATCAFDRAFFETVSNLEITHLHDTPDPTFSAHLSDTADAENYADVGAAVQDHRCALGVMFDGDGDRIGLVDEHGAMINGDMIMTIITAAMLRDAPADSTIVYEVKTTKSVRDLISDQGATGICSKVGYVFIKAAMREHGALFGGEASGHFMFPELVGAESPLLALYYVLQELQHFDSCSAMVAHYTNYYKGPQAYFHGYDTEQVIQALNEEFAQYQRNFIDGVTITGDDRWCNVRPSNTEPKLKVNIEATSPDQYQLLLGQVEKVMSTLTPRNKKTSH